jgi:lipoprotein-anchoring transpeptidase ErfK/SrfK
MRRVSDFGARYFLAALLVGFIALFAFPARAELVIYIDKAAQRMSVEKDGVRGPVFVVSTGRRGYGTPEGAFRPNRMERKWFSRRYYNSPMPHAIFFYKGYAIHGTNYLNQLGGPASHGCVRLHPANAAALFAMVKQEGMGRTRIVIGN